MHIMWPGMVCTFYFKYKYSGWLGSRVISAGLKRRRAWVQITVKTLSGNSFRHDCSHPLCLYSPSSKTGSSPLKGCGSNCRPTARFVTRIICRLTAKNRDQLRNPMLSNRVWATFTFSMNLVLWTFTVCFNWCLQCGCGHCSCLWNWHLLLLCYLQVDVTTMLFTIVQLTTKSSSTSCLCFYTVF